MGAKAIFCRLPSELGVGQIVIGCMAARTLREELLKVGRQKPRYGYRRLHALLSRHGHEVNVKRVYRLYVAEGLSVRRRKRKRLVRDRAADPRLLRANQEWAMDFIVDGLANRPDGAHPERSGCVHA